jgi:flagellar hook assembly protein FlgD
MVEFALPEAGPVKLVVLDVSGRLVKTLINGKLTAGRHVELWDGSNESGASLPAGVYFFSLEIADKRTSAKVVLHK